MGPSSVTNKGAPSKRKRDASGTSAAKIRSRSGCVTCREKHVKCDEEKPTCNTCSKKGWTCGGYSSGLKWSNKHQLSTTTQPKTQKRAKTQAREVGEGSINGQVWIAVNEQPADVLPKEASTQVIADDFFSTIDAISCSVTALNTSYNRTLEVEPQLFEPSDLSEPPNWPLETISLVPSPPLAGQLADPTSASVSSSGAWDAYNFGSEEPPRRIPRSPVITENSPDAAIILINRWFEQVCPAWSGFDSNKNMNRKLAADLWGSSASVFNSLQSMSASFLAARQPHMRRPAITYLKSAAECVQWEVDQFHSQKYIDTLPTGLLFSLTCLGTTLCWLDASRTGTPLLKQAKNVLRRVLQQDIAPGERTNILGFFKRSLQYWEMMVCVVDDGVMPTDEEYPEDASQFHTDIIPHPWTGASSLSQRLFTRAITLCRTYRRKITSLERYTVRSNSAVDEIRAALRLEEQLLELDFTTFAHSNDTGDCRTPWQHLARTAEAYQIASLLQLYVTFPELVSLRLPQERDSTHGSHVPWDRWITPLALRLVGILEQIPSDSGSSLIQLLLLISASVGLRNSPVTGANLTAAANTAFSQKARSQSPNSNIGILDYIDEIAVGEERDDDASCLPQVLPEVRDARNFVLSRLSLQENILHPNPILVAQTLIKSVWKAYDEEPLGSTSVHWLDIMEKKGFRSLFG